MSGNQLNKFQKIKKKYKKLSSAILRTTFFQNLLDKCRKKEARKRRNPKRRIFPLNNYLKSTGGNANF